MFELLDLPSKFYPFVYTSNVLIAVAVFRGYLEDQEMNEKKFIPNWFVDNEKWVALDQKRSKGEAWRRYYKGPRDRLYRFVKLK